MGILLVQYHRSYSLSRKWTITMFAEAVKFIALFLALAAVAYCQDEALAPEADGLTGEAKEKFGYYGYGHLAHHGYGYGHLGYAHLAGYGYAHPGYYGHAYGYGHGYAHPYGYW